MSVTHLTRQRGEYAMTFCGRSARGVKFTLRDEETTCKTCLKRRDEIEG